MSAVDSEVNIDFVESVLSTILANTNPKYLGSIKSEECEMVRLPDNLEVMSMYHQELANRFLTDSA